MQLPAPLRNFYERWLARRLPSARQIVLDQRRIFIFPTGYGFFYLLVAALLFIGGINYENNLILALSFLMASLFLVAILIVYHFYCGHLVKVFRDDRNTRSHVFYRWFNELPVLILLAVVILAVVKPF